MGGSKFPVRLISYTSISETLLVYEGHLDGENDALSNTNGKKSV